jgi:hypothetical protein
MIIYVPQGSSDDNTILPSYYNGTFNYLKQIGLEEIE